MGKSQTSQSTTMANDNNKRALSQGDTTQGDLKDQLGPARQTSQGTYSQASDAYNGYSGGTGSYNPAEYDAVQSQNRKNTETGGYSNPEQLSTLKSHIQQNTQTGGYTPEELSQLQMGGLGGINSESAGTIRSGYNNLINTGGISDDTAGAMRRQAAGTTQSIYATMGENLARKQSVAGMGGAGGETAQMARQAAQSGATATTGANAEIGKLRQTGTIAGLGGLSSFEENAAQGMRDVDKSAAAGRLQGTDEEAHLASDQAHNTLQASQASQDLASNAASQRIAAAGGLVNLYNSSPGYVNSLVQQILQSQSLTGTLTSQQAQIMQELSKNPGLYDNIMKGISSVGGAAGGVMTGIGSLP